MSSFPKPLDDADQTPVTAPAAPNLEAVEAGAEQVAAPDKTVELPAGTAVGGYVVESLLGAGGCGQVYRARHEKTGRRVAIKVMRSEIARVPTAVPRFIREVAALSRIVHDNIVGSTMSERLGPGVPYYVMELLEGVDLRQLLAVHQRLSAREALPLLEAVGAALHCAHEQGIVHRDVKASNVFVSNSGGKQIVKLLDFGIAKLMYGERRCGWIDCTRHDGRNAPRDGTGTDPLRGDR